MAGQKYHTILDRNNKSKKLNNTFQETRFTLINERLIKINTLLRKIQELRRVDPQEKYINNLSISIQK